jgi:alginate export protein
VRRWTLGCVGLVAVAAPAWAETQFDIGGQIRVRFEVFDFNRTVPPDSNFFRHRSADVDILERARLGVNATIAEGVHAYVQVQDSRVFGTEASTLSNEHNLDVHQAWGEVQRIGSSRQLYVRAGRQQLSYGNERIVGAVDFSNIGRAFDALQTRVQSGPWTFDLVAARVAEDVPASDDVVLSYNRYAVPNHDVGVEAYAMYRDADNGYFETTLGEHAAGTLGRIRFDHEFAAMLGSRQGEDIEAYLFSTQAHLRLGGPGAAAVGGGFDYFTGDEAPGDGKFHLFDVNRTFHTGHKFYGLMDVAEFLAGAAGLVDPYGAVSVQGPGKLKATATVHGFFADQPARLALDAPLPVSEQDSYLGTELDTLLSFAVAPQTQLEVFGGFFFPGQFLSAQDRGRTATWVYVQGTVDF